MLIREFIRSAVKDGALVHLRPRMLSENCVRQVFATKYVWDALTRTDGDVQIQIRMSEARALVDNFITGKVMSVRLPPSKKVTAMLALLEDKDEEVWEFRSRSPRPGIRIFGRFSEKDVFIATNYSLKEYSESIDQYTYHKARCKREWGMIFPIIHPLKGQNCDEYLSNYTIV